MRLLFSHEFELEPLCALWDAIFAHGARFELVPPLALAMLVHVRAPILAANDEAAALGALLRFPRVPRVQPLIESALRLAAACDGPPHPPAHVSPYPVVPPLVTRVMRTV